MANPYGGIVAIRTHARCYGIQATVHLPNRYAAFAFRIYDPAHKVDTRHDLKVKYRVEPLLAQFFNVDYFDAYLGFDNPEAHNDPRVEAGIFKYGDRDGWTYFLNTLNPAPKSPPPPPPPPRGSGWPFIEEFKRALERIKTALMLLPPFRQDMERVLKASRSLATPLQQGVTWTERNVAAPPHTLCLKLIFDPKDWKKACFFVNGALCFSLPFRVPISEASYAAGGLRMKACIGMDNRLGTVQFDRMRIDQIKIFKDRECRHPIDLAPGMFEPVKTPDDRGLRLRPEGTAGLVIDCNNPGPARSEALVLAMLALIGVTVPK